jgi:hypothetical protein
MDRVNNGNGSQVSKMNEGQEREIARAKERSGLMVEGWGFRTGCYEDEEVYGQVRSLMYEARARCLWPGYFPSITGAGTWLLGQEAGVIIKI